MSGANLRSVVAADMDMSAVVDLAVSVGWTAYTNRPDQLRAALAGSSHIVVANLDAALVGLARVISDSASIVYLQDVQVHPAHPRHGIGAHPLRSVLRPYEHVRQQVLLTDDERALRAFYARLGWRSLDETRPPLRAFVLPSGSMPSPT